MDCRNAICEPGESPSCAPCAGSESRAVDGVSQAAASAGFDQISSHERKGEGRRSPAGLSVVYGAGLCAPREQRVGEAIAAQRSKRARNRGENTEWAGRTHCCSVLRKAFTQCAMLDCPLPMAIRSVRRHSVAARRSRFRASILSASKPPPSSSSSRQEAVARFRLEEFKLYLQLNEFVNKIRHRISAESAE